MNTFKWKEFTKSVICEELMPHFGVFEGWVGRIESVISISEQEYAISFVKHQNRGPKVKTWYDRVCTSGLRKGVV